MLVIVLVACCNLGWPVKATVISLIDAAGTNRARLVERVSAAVWSPTAIRPEVWAQDSVPRLIRGAGAASVGRVTGSARGDSGHPRPARGQGQPPRALPPCRPALAQAPRLTCGCRQHPRRPGHQYQGRRAQESEHGVGKPNQWLASPASSSGAVEPERIPEQRGPLRDVPPLPIIPAPPRRPALSGSKPLGKSRAV